MPRQRILNPAFYLDEDLAKVSMAARVLFPCLWTLADKAGRLEDRPQRIRAQAFPYEPEVDAESLLAELAAHNFVLRYEVHGRQYLQIRTFTQHQSPHPREPESQIPPITCEAAKSRGPQLHAISRSPVTVPIPVSIPDPVAVLTPAEPADPLASDTEAVYEHWSAKTETSLRAPGPKAAVRKRIRQRLKEGFTAADLCTVVDFALRDEFYREKGYPKNTEVLWKNAERVQSLLARAQQVPTQALARASPQPATSPMAQRRLDGINQLIEGGLKGDGTL